MRSDMDLPPQCAKRRRPPRSIRPVAARGMFGPTVLPAYFCSCSGEVKGSGPPSVDFTAGDIRQDDVMRHARHVLPKSHDFGYGDTLLITGARHRRCGIASATCLSFSSLHRGGILLFLAKMAPCDAAITYGFSAGLAAVMSPRCRCWLAETLVPGAGVPGPGESDGSLRIKGFPAPSLGGEPFFLCARAANWAI